MVYSWYVPFLTRLRQAVRYEGHVSPAYRGDPKAKPPKLPWSIWRKAPARIWVVIDVFISQPEYWLVSHFNLSYPQCARLRQLFYWQTKLYLQITGFTEE